MSAPTPRRLSRDQLLALKFAVHRQLARWAKARQLRPRQQAQRAALVSAVRVLEDKALADGCDLTPTGEQERAPAAGS
jgi:hypothetical protein